MTPKGRAKDCYSQGERIALGDDLVDGDSQIGDGTAPSSNLLLHIGEAGTRSLRRRVIDEVR